MLANYYILSGKKPLMVTEYSWRAAENSSGNPNTGGAGADSQDTGPASSKLQDLC